jgi:hypothetical protein
MGLGGITAELNNDGHDRIEIMVGEKPEDHVTHNIVAPTQINLEQPDEGADAMQMSRSVITPMTFLASSTTGSTPQSCSHIIIAAVLALFWLWTGVAYHLAFFTGINKALQRAPTVQSKLCA